MLKQNKHPRNKLKLGLLVAALALLILGGVLAFHIRNASNKAQTSGSNIDYSPATNAENNINDAKKGATDNSQTPSGKSDTATSSTPAAFDAIITNASANSDTRAVRVGTLVKGTTSGSCTLTATQTGQPNVVKTSTVHQDVNYYDCGIFNISFSEFPNSGKWTFTLTVIDGNAQSNNTWGDSVTVPST